MQHFELELRVAGMKVTLKYSGGSMHEVLEEIMRDEAVTDLLAEGDVSVFEVRRV